MENGRSNTPKKHQFGFGVPTPMEQLERSKKPANGFAGLEA
jgi:hypothetical protein